MAEILIRYFYAECSNSIFKKKDVINPIYWKSKKEAKVDGSNPTCADASSHWLVNVLPMMGEQREDYTKQLI